ATQLLIGWNARRQPYARKCNESADHAGDTQHQPARQEPLLERAQGLGQRQLGDPCQQARLAGDCEIENPRPDGDRQRDDSGSCTSRRSAPDSFSWPNTRMATNGNSSVTAT